MIHNKSIDINSGAVEVITVNQIMSSIMTRWWNRHRDLMRLLYKGFVAIRWLKALSRIKPINYRRDPWIGPQQPQKWIYLKKGRRKKEDRQYA